MEKRFYLEWWINAAVQDILLFAIVKHKLMTVVGNDGN